MSAVNTSFEKLLDYEQRSFAFEPGHAEGQSHSGEWAGVVFRIGDTRLACNIEQVHEFLPIPAFTPVPGTKPWILGLANVRGDLLTIVDLAWFLSGQRSAVSMKTRLLTASLRGRPIGLGRHGDAGLSSSALRLGDRANPHAPCGRRSLDGGVFEAHHSP